MMTSWMFELGIAIVVLEGVGLLGFLLFAGYAWTHREVIRGFRCEFKREFVLVTFVANPFWGRYLNVKCCSALGAGEYFDCGKRCLDRMQSILRSARE